MHPDDGTLVRQAGAGDQTAYRVLVDRHGRSVFRLAFRITGSREDAEDVVQETFVRAFRQLDRFESRSNFGTWLYRIGFNCAVDFTRARPHRETAEAPEVLDQRPDARRSVTGDDLLFAGQVTSRVHAALQELSDHERAAFVLRHYHQCSIDEIGRALDLRRSAAKHAVFRAVRKMRIALRPLMTTGSEGTEA
jgi:RNA polymerase sigma-70 factor, ECF subfamily